MAIILSLKRNFTTRMLKAIFYLSLVRIRQRHDINYTIPFIDVLTKNNRYFINAVRPFLIYLALRNNTEKGR